MDFLLQENVSLKLMTSLKVGGCADLYAEPENLSQLKAVYKWSLDEGHPLTIMGDGTNVLISDKGIRGLVINLKKMKGMDSVVDKEFYRVTALAGTTKSQLLKGFIKNQLSPALFLAGLPGNVAGGVVMNAGVGEKITPREFCEIVEWIDVLKPNLEVKRFLHNDIEWSYRATKNWRPGIVYRVGLRWPMADRNKEIIEDMKRVNKVRLNKQPLDKPNCGSVFANPQGDSAGRLIEECGLKGYKIGGAQISKKHANFIVTEPGVMAENVYALILHIQSTVKKEKKISLKREVQLLGEWS